VEVADTAAEAVEDIAAVAVEDIAAVAVEVIQEVAEAKAVDGHPEVQEAQVDPTEAVVEVAILQADPVAAMAGAVVLLSVIFLYQLALAALAHKVEVVTEEVAALVVVGQAVAALEDPAALDGSKYCVSLILNAMNV